MKAFITFFGPNGGQQSSRRELELLHLADGTYRAEWPAYVPVRASWAKFEIVPEPEKGIPLIDLDLTGEQVSEVGRKFADNLALGPHGY